MVLSGTTARTIYLIKRFETVIKSELELALRDLALTPGQYTTMSLLKANNEISSAALARRVAVSPQSMSEMIVALGKKGFLERRENPENRRILRIELSEAGAKLLNKCEQRVSQLEINLLAPLHAKEVDLLRSLLGRVLEKTSDQEFK